MIKREIDLKPYLDHIKNKFIKTIDSLVKINNPKDIICMDSIKSIFELILDIDELKNRNVQLAWLNDKLWEYYKNENLDNLILFIPNETYSVNLSLNFIKKVSENNTKTKLHLIIYPKITYPTKELIKKMGLNITLKKNLYEFDFDLIPLDTDLLSLEYEESIKELYATHEFNIHNSVAKSIQKIEYVFGKINLKFFKGSNAIIVKNILNNLQKLNKNNLNYENKNSEFDAICILDRKIDNLTPFITQFTYSGRIDETYQTKINSIMINTNIIYDNEKDEVKNFPLTDIIYNNIKNYNFTSVGIFLKNKLNDFQKLAENKERLNDLNEMKKISKELKSKKYVEIHINLSHNLKKLYDTVYYNNCLLNEQESIYGVGSNSLSEFILDLISIEFNTNEILRLVIIGSLTDNGFTPKIYDNMKTQFVNVFGIDGLNKWLLFEDYNLIFNKEKGKNMMNFSFIRKNLKLINENNKDEISSFYDGFIPLMIRVIESFLRDGWKNDFIEKIPGDINIEGGKFMHEFLNKSKKKNVLIYVIGGLTYSEISAIRLLGKLFNREITIAVTSIINKNKIIQNLY